MPNAAASADEPSDEAVVARLSGGDHESVVLLLVRYAPQVLSVATSALDRAAAEEIVQDVFIAVWRGAQLRSGSGHVPQLVLQPMPGVEPKMHGTYRGRAGETLAVMTFSNFAPAPSGKEYLAWARHGEQWTRLGSVSLDTAGNGRLVAEDAALSTPPDALRVTLEATGDRSAKMPAGTTIIVWPVEP